jgi:hypothetical protein
MKNFPWTARKLQAATIPKRWYLYTIVHDSVVQRIGIYIKIAVRTWNFALTVNSGNQTEHNGLNALYGCVCRIMRLQVKPAYLYNVKHKSRHRRRSITCVCRKPTIRTCRNEITKFWVFFLVVIVNNNKMVVLKLNKVTKFWAGP